MIHFLCYALGCAFVFNVVVIIALKRKCGRIKHRLFEVHEAWEKSARRNADMEVKLMLKEK